MNISHHWARHIVSFIVPSFANFISFFRVLPFPSSTVFVLSLPLPQSPAVCSKCIFFIFPPSHFNTFALLFPFGFPFVFLFKFVVPSLSPGVAVASGFNFTNALILALAFYLSYVIVLMSPLFCSCFTSPIPLSLAFLLPLTCFLPFSHSHPLPMFLGFFCTFLCFSYFLLLSLELALAHALTLAHTLVLFCPCPYP